jgi:hypothetical protein
MMPRNHQHQECPRRHRPYSQAVKVGKTVYCPGRSRSIRPRCNWSRATSTCEITPRVREPEGDRGHSRRRLAQRRREDHVFLTDLSHFARVNEIMATYFKPPYPARAAVGVAAAAARRPVEIEGILELTRACRGLARRTASRRCGRRRARPSGTGSSHRSGSAVPAALALRGPHARRAHRRAGCRFARGDRGRGAWWPTSSSVAAARCWCACPTARASSTCASSISRARSRKASRAAP